MGRVLRGAVPALLLVAWSAIPEFAFGAVRCGAIVDTVQQSTQPTTLMRARPYRVSSPGRPLLARDIEFLWDESFGFTPDTSPTLQATLFSFASTVDFATGLNPLVQDANGLQAVWNYFRREGADWNSVNPLDVASLRIGNSKIPDSDDRPLGAYPDSDRCHVDAYLLTPQTMNSSPTHPSADGAYPSEFADTREDVSSWHPDGEILHRNAIEVRGPASSQALDPSGTGWTSPAGRSRSDFLHEMQHSFVEDDPANYVGGDLGELWSAGAEAVSGIFVDSLTTDEVPYTAAMARNYQLRTSFMAYLGYNFLNTDTTRTLLGMRDDLLYRWSRGTRTFSGLLGLLGNADCATCASKAYFSGLSNQSRLALLQHNWRIASLVNNASLGEHQYGWPAWGGFSPGHNLRAWQALDSSPANDLYAIATPVTVTPLQAVREMTIKLTRGFRGGMDTLSLVPYGANYWAFRSDPTLASSSQDLLIRVAPTGGAHSVNRASPWFTYNAYRFLGSTVAYPIPDSTDASILWRHPESVTQISGPQFADSDSLAPAMEFVVPDFGRANKSAVLVLSLGDLSLSPVDGEGPQGAAQPYRLEVSLRNNPADSTRAVSLTVPGSTMTEDAAWSPRGDELACMANVPQLGNYVQIYRRRLDGSAPTRLVPEVRGQYYPDWSPRGDLVAYEGVIGPGQSAIWTVDPTTSTPAQHRITFANGIATQPVFQPDGQGIAYIHRPSGDLPWELRYVASDGTGDRLVTSFAIQSTYRRPSWNPQGSRIFMPLEDGKLYSVARAGGAWVEDATVRMPVQAIDLPRGSGRVVIETTAPYPIYARDLPFVSDANPGPLVLPRIALLDTVSAHRDTSYRYVLRGNAQSNRRPRYSPDGTRIAFTKKDSTTNLGQLYIGRITPNHAPLLQPVADVNTSACLPVQFQLSATDPDGEAVTYRADELPPGATCTAAGAFSLAAAPVGTFWGVFRAMDGSGGVDTRVVKFTFVDNGSCGDPLGEGDPGIGLGHHAIQTRMLPGAGAPVSVSNSLLDGADAGQWVERTARLTAFTAQANGRCQGTLWTSLNGSTTLDCAELVIVDHPAEANAFASPHGLMVGMRRPVASLTDAEGRGLSAALTAGNSEPALVSGGSSLTVEADTSANALVLECARLGEPGTSDSSGIVVEGFDGVSWQELGRVHPRRSRDTLAVATEGAAQLRLTPLSDIQLWAVDALEGSDSLAARTSTVTVPLASTSRPGAAQALALADSAGVTLGSSQSLMLTFDGPPLPETGVRSLFLKLRARYEQTGTGLVRNQQAGDSAILPFALHPNQPNPFAHGTTIRFDMPMAAFVRIEAFDAVGRRVRTLAEGQYAPGAHALAWNGADDSGRPLRPGVYLVRMAAGPYTARRRMVLLGN